jgi:hypothetical protein
MFRGGWPKTLAVLILALLVGGQAHGFTFTFPPFFGSSDRDNQGPPPGPPPWQFRPQQPSNARGMPPGFTPPAGQGQAPGYQQGPGFQPGFQQGPGYQPGGWQQQYGAPYGRQQAPRQTSRPPRLELELTERQPYVQENLLLTLRVISDRNLETATPELPNTSDLLLQKLDGPNARARTGSDGSREIVNEFVYTVTPLRAGDVEVPRLTVSGTLADSGFRYGQGAGQRYEAESGETIPLQVRPAMASVRPWLPLQDLTLNATLDGGGEVEAGQPVTLVLTLDAVGATGAQLPSLEGFLTSPDFRVYREQTLTEGKVSSDGRRLEGKRTEYYTLVPRSGGKLALPEIRLPWWNVKNGTREHAGLPIHTLEVEGESGRFGLGAYASTASPGGASWFWLPLVGVILLLLGYWVGVWYKGRAGQQPERGPLGERLGAGLRTVAAKAGAGMTSAAARLNPAPALARIRPQLTRAMPPSSRFLMCVRAANREQDPAAWAARFQDMTCRHLQFDAQNPLPGLTGQILLLRPGADPEQLERLMQQLDGALYGKQDIDFARWKKQFSRQIGRGRGVVRGTRQPRFRRPLLPELNPQSAG